jgi:hypothetical protein
MQATQVGTNIVSVYFNCLIDTESHPEIEQMTKKEIMEVASKLTTNKITFVDWEKGSYLIFAEIIDVDPFSKENRGYSMEAIINDLHPQCPEPEFSFYRKAKA